MDIFLGSLAFAIVIAAQFLAVIAVQHRADGAPPAGGRKRHVSTQLQPILQLPS